MNFHSFLFCFFSGFTPYSIVLKTDADSTLRIRPVGSIVIELCSKETALLSVSVSIELDSCPVNRAIATYL